jgi:hypothetical protein
MYMTAFPELGAVRPVNWAALPAQPESSAKVKRKNARRDLICVLLTKSGQIYCPDDSIHS